ncbi:hypothetical protein GO986_12955 [Deinococcus sp. HMF7620]|uniref:Uncharacterized protein n=1 Tax=Deinococcus arboris TaxID=2682977 RepID=A0A7C9I3S7_9DEIO|nr:hypothetical protein [Deinococcus arboris]MVN87671.1 hypothetical protein [Deinococcus arboris]
MKKQQPVRFLLLAVPVLLAACQTSLTAAPSASSPVAAQTTQNFQLTARVPVRVARAGDIDTVLTLMNTSAQSQQVDMNLCPVAVTAKSVRTGATITLMDPAATLCARYIQPVTLAPGGSARYPMSVPGLSQAGEYVVTFSTRYAKTTARITVQ